MLSVRRPLIWAICLCGFQLSCLGFAVSQDELTPETLTTFDDQLRDFMEFVRLQMKCGYAPAGIPPLAPFQKELIVLKLGEGDVSFTDFTVTGLDAFEVFDLRWNNVKSKITFDFRFESILLESPAYEMQMMTQIFGPLFKIHGNGVFYLDLQNVRFHGSFRLRPTLSGGLSAFAVNANLDMESSKSKSTGIMNSPFYSKLFNSWLEEFLSITFNDEPEVVSNFVETRITPPMNAALKNVSMVELIALILNLAGDVIPENAIC